MTKGIFKKRDLVYAELNYMEKLISEDQESDAVITSKIQQLNSIKDRFDEAQHNAEMHAEEAELVSQQELRSVFYKRYYTLLAQFQTQLSDNLSIPDSTERQRKPSEPKDNISVAVQQLIEALNQPSVTVKNSSHLGFELPKHLAFELPKHQLKKFSGDFTEFPSFKEIFENIVHKNDSIEDFQKFLHLKEVLSGEASALISNLEITGENYTKAWKLLQDAYDKPRFRVETHLSRMFSSEHNISKFINIKEFLITITEADAALTNLTAEERYNAIMIFLAADHLDEVPTQLWRRYSSAIENPKFADFLKFLAQRKDELDTSRQNTSRPKASKRPSGIHMVSTAASKCFCCYQQHELYKCPVFISKELFQRWNFIKQLSLCQNYLRRHPGKQCISRKCIKCNRAHHTLLHREQPLQPTEQRSSPQADLAPTPGHGSTTVSNASNPTNSAVVGLGVSTSAATAIIKIQDSTGQWQSCRALIDNGAQLSLITNDCAQRLKLRRSHLRIPLVGICDIKTGSTMGEVQLHIKNDKSYITTTAAIVSKVACDLPTQQIKLEDLKVFNHIQLADPNFHVKSKVDIILGSDCFYQILRDGRILTEDGLAAHNTIFSWIVGGRLSSSINEGIFHVTLADLDQRLSSFWEDQEIIEEIPITDEHRIAEQHYFETHTRDDQGRYIVRLPFKSDNDLGESKPQAIRRLLAMERRLSKDESLRTQYKDFMTEYLQLGHMRRITSNEVNSPGYYMPHHAVIKESSTTTKLRVVFDASQKTSNGKSLNDVLIVGPTIQPDLFTLLIRFRTNPVAMMADIENMYRKIWVNHQDIHFHRIVYRFDPADPIEEWVLLTVTYGDSSAPFSAIRTLHQLADDEGHNYPRELWDLLS